MSLDYNVLKTIINIINHPPNHNFYRWYKPFPVMGSLWHCFNHITSGPGKKSRLRCWRNTSLGCGSSEAGMGCLGCLGCAAHGQSVVGQSMANQHEFSVSRNSLSTKKASWIAKKRWQLIGCFWYWQSQMIPHVIYRWIESDKQTWGYNQQSIWT